MFAKWRDFKRNSSAGRKDVEGPSFNLLVEPLIGGGDNSDIDFDGNVRPDRFESLFLQNAKDLGLHLQTHVSDFVQEERASVRLLELTALCLSRTRERALGVAEKLRLDQLLGNCRTVQLDEGHRRPADSR